MRKATGHLLVRGGPPQPVPSQGATLSPSPPPGLDLLPLCVTFLLCFWEVQYGILAGTLVSGLILLHSVARPHMEVPAPWAPREVRWPQGPRGLRQVGPLGPEFEPAVHLWPVPPPSGCPAGGREPPSQTTRPAARGPGRGEGPRQPCTPVPPKPGRAAPSDSPPGLAVCLHRCPQVSEGPVLVVQLASGLHFPAVEALREAIASRALEGTWARAGVTAAPSAPGLLLRHPKALPSTVRAELAPRVREVRVSRGRLLWPGVPPPSSERPLSS